MRGFTEEALKIRQRTLIILLMEICPVIEDKVCSALRCAGVNETTHLLAAVSGGADSVALLRLLQGFWSCGYIGALSAAHFHHGIRKEGADADEAFVRALCEEAGIPFFTGHGDVPEYAAQHDQTMEEAARNARYAFLRETKQICGADYIVTAHTMNDQAETVLLHILRGSGVGGLCGMRTQAGDVLRPMLAVQRQDIEAYLSAAGQPYQTDESNASLAYTRNRVRIELLPMLAERFNPAVIPALSRLAGYAQTDEDYLNALAEDALDRAQSRQDAYRREALLALPQALRMRALRLALARVDALFDVEQASLCRLESMLSGRTGSIMALPNEKWAQVSYNDICFGTLPKESEAFSVPFCWDGETITPLGSFFTSRVSVRQDGDKNRIAFFDMEKLPRSLVVRSRQPQDRIQPLGMQGKKKLKDYFIDHKLPRWQRVLPLLCSENDVLFVPGCCIAEPYRVTPETKMVLRVEYRQT